VTTGEAFRDINGLWSSECEASIVFKMYSVTIVDVSVQPETQKQTVARRGQTGSCQECLEPKEREEFRRGKKDTF